MNLSLVPMTPLRDNVRAWLGTALFPRATWRWRRFIHQHPPLQKLARSTPQFVSKIYGPYLNGHTTCANRVELLIAHYRMLFDLGYAHMVPTVREPLLLAEFHGRDRGPYRLELCRPMQHRHWGEVALRLTLDGRLVYLLAFTITRDGDDMVLTVGGIEGLLATDDEFCIKRITRDLRGLRPRDLLVFAVVEIARHFYCSRVILTGNRNKLPSHSRHVCRRSSDYDRAWRELNATPRTDGDFELACRPGPSRPYRLSRRAADRLMEDIRCDLIEHLRQLRDPGAQPRLQREQFLASTTSSTLQATRAGVVAAMDGLPAE